MTTPRILEPATGDDRIMSDIYLSADILPTVAACDELGVFSLLEEAALSTAKAATRLNLAEEWAEILLGVLGGLKLVRVRDGRFHLTDAARSFLLPDRPYYWGFSLRRFAQNDVGARLKHDWAAEHRTQLIKHAFDALPSGGRMYVHEMLLNDAGDGPPARRCSVSTCALERLASNSRQPRCAALWSRPDSPRCRSGTRMATSR